MVSSHQAVADLTGARVRTKRRSLEAIEFQYPMVDHIDKEAMVSKDIYPQ